MAGILLFLLGLVVMLLGHVLAGAVLCLVVIVATANAQRPI